FTENAEIPDLVTALRGRRDSSSRFDDFPESLFPRLDGRFFNYESSYPEVLDRRAALIPEFGAYSFEGTDKIIFYGGSVDRQSFYLAGSAVSGLYRAVVGHIDRHLQKESELQTERFQSLLNDPVLFFARASRSGKLRVERFALRRTLVAKI